jgi:hypothetical protein
MLQLNNMQLYILKSVSSADQLPQPDWTLFFLIPACSTEELLFPFPKVLCPTNNAGANQDNNY